jgi:multidrug efflux pump subunit AcrA (membrane-fusion protein)
MISLSCQKTLAWGAATAALFALSLAASAARAQEQQPPAPVTVAPVTKSTVAATVAATGTVVRLGRGAWRESR